MYCGFPYLSRGRRAGRNTNMRLHTLLSIALLGLLLGASGTRADDPQAENESKETRTSTQETPEEEEETKEPPKKEKTTEIEEESDVMILHVNNFARALNQTRYLLVEFYAPWCGHCKRLEPVYAEAAGKLKEEGSSMRLAKVDAVDETELATEFEIRSFPTLKMFIDGDRKNPVKYSGQRSVERIIQWMKRHSGPGTLVLDSVDSAAQFIDSHNITIVGFFDDLESEGVKAFNQLALNLVETEFALSASPEVFKKYEVKASSVVLFKKFDDGRADFLLLEDGKFDPEDLTTFIKQNSLELIIPFSQESSEKIFTSGITLHSLLFINSSVESHTALVGEAKTVAKEFKGKMLFIAIDVTAALSHVLEYFGVSERDAPTVRLVDMETGKKFVTASGDLSLDSLRQLCKEVVAGTAKPYYRSEDVPEDWDKGAVKVLVGKNFESVALDTTKNVFVEFYAPWCGHCKELSPIWEQLGEKYADRDDIIIAKMDSTANEVESLDIKGFPTLKYFPADGKEVVDYTGKRDLETMSKFLDDGGVLPKDEEEEEFEDGDADDEGDVESESDIPTNTTTKDEL